ncbi:MAG: phosphoribosylformylglycinamidine synthase subunit PurL, partial [Pyramidobacter sp.]|nr:phosphoribosylformylglycinamidine synthase subunit PurL [Pyramidobacter sp.]
QEGDVLFLAGWNEGTLAASVYQRHYSAGDFAGRPVPFNADRERRFNDAARAVANTQAAHSARPLIGGGLAVAVAKEAIDSGVGVKLNVVPDCSTVKLFGEGGTAAVYAVSPANVEEFKKLWEGIPLTELGTVGGDCLAVGGECAATVEQLTKAYRS